ncbi:Defline double C2 domain protein [Lottia gigantea]|uniref:Defline double C2 domain protein n=1 Tax=Lottia gigantea TaxID=225164 RepID=V3ZJM1_LOTGI|nr:Defline double C2 domain protein [Lottia gigantea]ESO82570.1 Defline double C2 domain protein [Lottia gigantea]
MGTGPSTVDQPVNTKPLSQDPAKIEKLTRFLEAKAARDKSVTVAELTDKYEQDKQSMKMLQGLFKKLDPRYGMAKTVGEVTGEIQISFKYDVRQEILLVKIIKCRELRCGGIRSKTSSPYVKMDMYPDNYSQGSQVTQIVVEENNPVFSEIFKFRTSEIELIENNLVVQVWDYDAITQDDFLGEVIIRLQDFDFNKSIVHTAWYNLNTSTDLSITGEVEVSLNYQLPDQLTVTIHHCIGLSPPDGQSSANPFIKVAIPGTKTVHSTGVMKNSLDPKWEESFDFSVAQEEFAFRYIVLHVIDDNNTEGNCSLGQVIIDLDTFNPVEEHRQTYKLADLKNSEHLKNKTMQSSISQELRESFLAHAAVQHPKFLFQGDSHTGKRIVTVTCRKAKNRAKIRVVDGILVA